MRLLYVDMGHTSYYGIGNSKLRKILEMTFSNAAGPSSLTHPPRLLLNKTNVTEENALAQLREAYRGTGIEVRFYPSCLTSLRWQIGSNGDGEHFTLIAYGSTPGRLIKCLESRARSQGRNGH